MHVVIDLGEKYSSLVCWERGRYLDDACIKIKLPGLAVLQASPNKTWDYDNLHKYISYLYREYLLPSRKIIESAALAVPDIFDLRRRRILLDILEEILGLYEAIIIPHPIALAAGIRMHNPHPPLSGDILVVEKQELNYNFAFISIIDTVGITLEKQFSGDFPDLLAEADRSGYYTAAGWRLDHLLLAGNCAQGPTMSAFLGNMSADLNVIYDQEPNYTAAEGLSDINSYTGNTPFNIIYPYQFYIAQNNPAGLEKIAFDTSSLELDCGGRYEITSLSRGSIYNLAGDENRVHFRIYESKTADAAELHDPGQKLRPILEVNSAYDDLPQHMELVLDMAAATLRLQLTEDSSEETISSPEVLGIRLQANLKNLLQMLDRNESNEDLLSDRNIQLSSASEDDLNLPDQINHTLFHLYGLLQLWNDK